MNDPVENPRIARNVLSNTNLIRLTDWARQNVESCQTLSNKTLATMAGETLTLHLTSANIASALEAVNITKVKPKAPPTLEERVATLETQFELVTSRLLRALENIGAIQPPASSNMVFDITLTGPLKPENMATYLPHDQTKTIPSPDGRYIIGVDLPANMPAGTAPPQPDLQKLAINAANSEKLKQALSPEGQTLHGLPDLDLAAAEVKAERERDTSTFEAQPIHQAAATIADQP